MHWANFESRNLCCLQSFEVKAHMKFLSLFKQILSVCSTNVVKVQVSSILTGKKTTMRRGLFEPGVPERQSFTLTTRPPWIWC